MPEPVRFAPLLTKLPTRQLFFGRLPQIPCIEMKKVVRAVFIIREFGRYQAAEG